MYTEVLLLLLLLLLLIIKWSLGSHFFVSQTTDRWDTSAIFFVDEICCKDASTLKIRGFVYLQ